MEIMRLALAMLVMLAGCGRVGFDAEIDSAIHSVPACRALDASWTPQWSSLIEYEPFDGSGAIANGAHVPAKLGQDGIATNTMPGMAYVPGKVAQGIQFDGIDDVVTIALPTIDETAGDAVSVALWLNWNGVLYTGTGGSWTKVMLFTQPEYSLTFVGKGSGAVLGYNTGNGDLWGVPATGLANTWVHVVAVFFNGASDGAQLYLDGQPATMVQQLGSANSSHVGSSLLVAAYPSYPSFLAGTLDELAVWNARLTAADVQTLYDAQVHCSSGGGVGQARWSLAPEAPEARSPASSTPLTALPLAD